MSAQTSIEWTDRTWNPVTGCRKVSPGCKNCYAEGVALRFWATQYQNVEIKTCGPAGTVTRSRQFTDVMCHAERLREPLSWRKPSKVFVNSMSDLFHEDVPDVFMAQVFAIMARASHHTFQVLTKRPARALDYLRRSSTIESVYAAACADGLDPDIWEWPLSNVWLGVSVEDRDRLNRVDLLKDTPAAVRFISCEPLLEDLGAIILDAIDWIIVGGESGPKARGCNMEWIRRIVTQCQESAVPVFVKQLGTDPFYAYSDGTRLSDLNLTDRKGGNMDEWPLELRVRQFPIQR